ncbi:hypothetical protein SELR_25400 [Selenomonas ruminantium subsp. lactilytica TAM6421]|uniref:Transposase, Mutator family n=1 Tax=Selenomonas ruminantium subsp. lactilytica (strain NBRC 103574 / TAM6421) TaxID=927704 RepID=I0GU11_SELRL|nr:hypothetical protein [Selenomonas ruminantium]BAL84248.1 hypothetical protein SELR_25400 [Selenomonas ruminantium subsp. lactilytica TAM6421]
MTIMDNFENMTDDEARKALADMLGQVDRVTLRCMASAVDVYQRSQAGTLGKPTKQVRPAVVLDRDSFIVKQQVIPGEDTLKRIDRVIESNRRDVYGGSAKQKRFFLGLDCYLLGRCDGQRLERERVHSRKFGREIGSGKIRH